MANKGKFHGLNGFQRCPRIRAGACGVGWTRTRAKARIKDFGRCGSQGKLRYLRVYQDHQQRLMYLTRHKAATAISGGSETRRSRPAPRCPRSRAAMINDVVIFFTSCSPVAPAPDTETGNQARQNRSLRREDPAPIKRRPSAACRGLKHPDYETAAPRHKPTRRQTKPGPTACPHRTGKPRYNHQRRYILFDSSHGGHRDLRRPKRAAPAPHQDARDPALR